MKMLSSSVSSITCTPNPVTVFRDPTMNFPQMHNRFLSLRAHVKLRVEHRYSNGPICFLATKTSGREALNNCCLGCRCRQREACVLIVEARAFLHVWWHRRNYLAMFDVMCFSVLFSRNTTLRFSFIKDWIRFEKRPSKQKH